jgi:hypothetical protein
MGDIICPCCRSPMKKRYIGFKKDAYCPTHTYEEVYRCKCMNEECENYLNEMSFYIVKEKKDDILY